MMSPLTLHCHSIVMRIIIYSKFFVSQVSLDSPPKTRSPTRVRFDHSNSGDHFSFSRWDVLHHSQFNMLCRYASRSHTYAHVSFYTHPIPCWWVLDLIRVRAECCLRGSSVLVPVDKVVKFSPALKARFLR